MAFQMVYTSVRSGLVAGRSGFCTAARHKELKESIVARIEDLSAQYDRGLAGGSDEAQLPVIYQHRIITIREDRYHVLMRLGDAGNDYSGRTNHIAHSLVLEPGEFAGLCINPAEAILGLIQRGFWRTRYDEPARYFGREEITDLTALSPVVSLPAARWSHLTGSSANAAQLFDSSRPIEAGVVLPDCGEAYGEELLGLFAESLLILGADRSDPGSLWSIPFTSILQSSAERSQFRWCGILPSGSLLQQEARSGRKILTLGSTLSPPTGIPAQIAQGFTPRLAPDTSATEEQPTYRAIPLPNEFSQLPVEAIEASSSIPPTQLTPEVASAGYIPISLEDPNRAKRADRKRKGSSLLLFAGIAVLIVGLVIAGFLFANQDVRAAEEKVRELVEKGQWQEVRKLYTENKISAELKSRSPELANWDAASNAIVRFNKIELRPDSFARAVPGMDSAEEAIEKIKEKWAGEHETAGANLEEQVTRAENGAQSSVVAWNDSVKLLTDAWDAAGRRFEQEKVAPGETVEKLTAEFEKSLKQLNDHASDSAQTLEKLFQILKETITPAIDSLSELSNDDESVDSAREKANEGVAKISETGEKLEKLAGLLGGTASSKDLHRKAINTCVNLSEKLKFLLEPGVLESKKSVKAKITRAPPEPNLPALQTQDSSTQEKVSFPRTYVVPKTTAGEIDLTGVKEISPMFPAKFSILPISALRITEPEQTKESIPGKMCRILLEDNIYFNSIFLLSGAKERKLKVEKADGEFWSGFPGGFILRFPKTEASDSEFQIAVIDLPDPEAGNASALPVEQKYLLESPLNMFLNLSPDGRISLSDDGLNLLKRFDFSALPDHQFQVRLSGDYPLTFSVDKNISPVVQISSEIQNLNDELGEVEGLRNRVQEFEPYRQIVENLFPNVFSKDGIHKLRVTSKIGTNGPFFIERSDVSKPPSSRSKVIESLMQNSNPRNQDFPRQIQFLFESLETLANGDKKLNEEASQKIERYIFKSGDHRENGEQNPVLFGWIRIADLSKENGWSLASITDPTGRQYDQKSEAEKALEEYLANRYFSDFFKRWEEMFNEVKAKQFFEFAKGGGKAQSLKTPDQIRSEIRLLNDVRPRFENTVLSDDGEYFLDIVNDEYSFPLIKGIPSAK